MILHALLLGPLAFGPGITGNPTPELGDDLTELSLEDLLDIEMEVTSAGRKSQNIMDTAAAIFVIDSEDIRRSGMSKLPDLLRMVPGLEVSNLNSNTWAISARGFATQFGNKLLVQIDGRTIYTPLFSGVFWADHNLMLEDIDRIEVIRGPGAALWGANAVNGVINIITKRAEDTQGGLLSLRAGTSDYGVGAVRFGAETEEGNFYRVYARGFSRGPNDDVTGTGLDDDWSGGQFGFRFDSELTERDALTIQGDAGHTNGHSGATFPAAPPVFSEITDANTDGTEANLLARWTRTFSDTSDMALQVYYDVFDGEQTLADARVDTIDLDFQHRFSPTENNEIVWGFGYRHYDINTNGTFIASWTPEDSSNEIVSVFLQDEFQATDRLSLIFGAKLEENDYTKREFQPNARFVYRPNETSSFWGAASRASRTPSTVNELVTFTQGVIPGAPNTIIQTIGDGSVKAEHLNAYELGYRVQPREDLFLDTTVFLDDYDDLTTVELGAPFASGPDIVQPLFWRNSLQGKVMGAELAGDWRPSDRWRFQLSYTYLSMHLDADAGIATLTDPEGEEDDAPKHQVSLRTWHNINDDWDFDVGVYYVDALPGDRIDSYIRADVRVEYRPTEDVAFSIGAQNLFHDGELEQGPGTFGGQTASEAAAYASLTLSF